MLADSDPDIKAAYLLTMNMWHAETVAIIEGASPAANFGRLSRGGYRLALYRPGVRPRSGFMRWTRRPWMRRRLAAM